MRRTLFFAAAASALLAACLAGNASDASGVQPDGSNPEQTCAGALAEEANVRLSDIRPTSAEKQADGTTLVMLDLAGAAAPWRCTIDAAGKTSLEYQGEG